MNEPVIRIDGPRFVDAQGRTMILRGMNLGAESKLPSRPEGATHLLHGFFDHRAVSFIGRPLPIDEADEHLSRLSRWGFNHLRLAVTWEAIEHEGPGIYDTAFLDYVEALVAKAAAQGMTVHVDPHQDVWSRFAGGSGAPGWTMEAVGMDLTRVHETGAAILHQLHGDPFPRMVWPTNATKLASATMFTLFFAGDIFAPQARIDGEGAQDFLQRHYCAAMGQVAARLCGFSNVLGYETMNEPSHGYVGHQDLRRHESPVNLGESPTPFQSMLLGAGIPQEVPIYEVRLTGVALTGRRVLNPAGVRLWREGADCPWRQHGVWGVAADGKPRLLRPDYFSRAHGREVSFSRDCYLPFARRYAHAIHAGHAAAAILLQMEVMMKPPRWGADDTDRIVYAPHWYDSLTLILKRFNRRVAYDSLRHRLVVGRGAIRRSFVEQLLALRHQAHEYLRGAPVILGETGIPFDLRNRRSRRRGDHHGQNLAIDRVMKGVEAALMSVCWWNYAAGNDSVHGDRWNGEDFSVFSRDPRNPSPPSHENGRALEALVRPYPRVVAGELLALSFDRRNGSFSCSFRHHAGLPGPTVLFVPRLQYPHGCAIAISDGSYNYLAERQILTWEHTLDKDVHTIRIRRT